MLIQFEFRRFKNIFKSFHSKSTQADSADASFLIVKMFYAKYSLMNPLTLVKIISTLKLVMIVCTLLLIFTVIIE